MTRAELIQTILRSELQQWRTMTKEQLLNCLLLERQEVLDDLSHDTLVYMSADIDVAEVWAATI
jgi:hypothetical protein